MFSISCKLDRFDLVVDLAYDGRDGDLVGKLRCAETALPGDEDVAVGLRLDDDRLDDAVLTDRLSHIGEVLFVERLAVVFLYVNSVDGDLE